MQDTVLVYDKERKEYALVGRGFVFIEKDLKKITQDIIEEAPKNPAVQKLLRRMRYHESKGRFKKH